MRPAIRRTPLLLLAVLALALGALSTSGREAPAAAQTAPPTVTQACLTILEQAPPGCDSVAGSTAGIPLFNSLQITGTGFSTTADQTTFIFTQNGSATTYTFTTLACPSSTTCYASWPATPVAAGTTADFTLVAQVNGVTGTAGTTVTVYGPPRMYASTPVVANAFSNDQIAFIYCCTPPGVPAVGVEFGETSAQSVTCPNDYTCIATLSGSAFSGSREVTFLAFGGVIQCCGIYISPVHTTHVTAVGQILIDGAPAPQGTKVTPYLDIGGLQYKCPSFPAVGPDGYYAITMYGYGSCGAGGQFSDAPVYYLVNDHSATTSQPVNYDPTAAVLVSPVNLSVSSSAAPPPASAPSATPPPAPTPPPSQPMTITGRVHRVLLPLVSENQIAQQVIPIGGARVETLVGSTRCGEALTDRDGRFQLTVAAHPATAGCGRPGVTITLRVNDAATGDPLLFQSGASATVELRLPDASLAPPARWP